MSLITLQKDGTENLHLNIGQGDNVGVTYVSAHPEIVSVAGNTIKAETNPAHPAHVVIYAHDVDGVTVDAFPVVVLPLAVNLAGKVDAKGLHIRNIIARSMTAGAAVAAATVSKPNQTGFAWQDAAQYYDYSLSVDLTGALVGDVLDIIDADAGNVPLTSIGVGTGQAVASVTIGRNPGQAAHNMFARLRRGATNFDGATTIIPADGNPVPAAPPATIPAAPANVQGNYSQVSMGQWNLNVSWDSVPGATSYRIYVSQDGGQTFELADTEIYNYGSIVYSNGDTKQAYVTAVNSAGESVASDTITLSV